MNRLDIRLFDDGVFYVKEGMTIQPLWMAVKNGLDLKLINEHVNKRVVVTKIGGMLEFSVDGKKWFSQSIVNGVRIYE